MRSDTCPGERPVSQKPAPVTGVPVSCPRAKVAPAGKGGERPGVTLVTARGEHGHPLAVPRGTPGNRDRTGPHVNPAPGTGRSEPQGSGEAPAPRSRPAHTAGSRSPVGAGTPGWPHTPPQKHPRPLPPAGSGQEGVKLDSRNSPLRASPGPPLPPPQRKGPRAAAPAGRLSRAGRAPHPLPAPGHPGHPAPFPGPRHPWPPRAFPGALRIFSRSTPQPFPGPEHPRAPRIFPRDPRTPFRGYPAFPPGPGAPAPLSGAPPDTAPRGRRRMGGGDGGEQPLPPGVRDPGWAVRGCATRVPHGVGEGEGVRGVTSGRVSRGVTRGLT